MKARAPKAGSGAYRAPTPGQAGQKGAAHDDGLFKENMDYIRTMGKLESGGATA